MGVDNPDEVYSDEVTNYNSFKNKRAQYWWLLRDRFEATYNAVEHGVYTDPEKLISLDSSLKYLGLLKSELVRPQRKRTNNSIIQLESKADMKKRLMPSPNLADALVMCFANSTPNFKSGGKTPKRRRKGAMSA
jgi:phage terminase large subunit